jgi:hypothetical protein
MRAIRLLLVRSLKDTHATTGPIVRLSLFNRQTFHFLALGRRVLGLPNSRNSWSRPLAELCWDAPGNRDAVK